MEQTEIYNTRETGVAGLLSATYHFMMSKIMDRLVVEGYRDISKTQLHVLARFDSEGMTLNEISQRVQISVHIVSNIIKMLVTEGYAFETEEGADIGDYKYALTNRGYRVLAIVSKEQKAVEEEWQQYLGERELSLVISNLERLFNATLRAQQE